MSEILEMHPARIKPRDIARIVETLRHGGVVIAPSDSGSTTSPLRKKSAISVSWNATTPSPFSAPT